MISRLSGVFCAATLLVAGVNAANSLIGVAVTDGKFTLDHSTVVGNATLFQGSILETGGATSDLSLTTGLKMRLATDSKARIFRDALFLERGGGQVSGSKYSVRAENLRIVPTSSNSTASVKIGANHQLEVASLLGSLRVETEGGIPVGNLSAGTALSFSGQANAATPTTVHGVVEVHSGQYTLTDTTSHVTFQLHGANLQQYVGKTITASGNVEGTDTLQVLAASVDTKPVVDPPGGLSHAAIAGIVIAGAAALSLGIAAAVGAFSSSASR